MNDLEHGLKRLEAMIDDMKNEVMTVESVCLYNGLALAHKTITGTDKYAFIQALRVA